MYGYFKYVAKFYADGSEHCETGVTYAENFAKAMRQIEDYYGEELIEISIIVLEPYDVYVLEGPTRYDS